MNTQDFQDELEADLPEIIHCLTAPDWVMNSDDSIRYGDEARALELSSALVGWENKYGSDLLEEIESLIGDMARHLVENCGYGEE